MLLLSLCSVIFRIVLCLFGVVILHMDYVVVSFPTHDAHTF